MMRVLVASDAWEPQINGVVRTLQKLRQLGPELGLDLQFVTPDRFRTLPMPGYPEIRLAMLGPGAFAQECEHIRPDIIHVATEGPIGLAARQMALRQGLPLTTSYHTRFPEYLAARLPVPERASYAALRWFHNAADAILVSTPSLEAELRARGFHRMRRWSRGVDLSLYAPRTESHVPWPRPIFLNVGRVAVEKNLEAFLSLDLPGTKVIVGMARSAPNWRPVSPMRSSLARKPARISPKSTGRRMCSSSRAAPTRSAWSCLRPWPRACPLRPIR